MGAVAAVRIIHRRRLAEAPEENRSRLEQELAAEHEKVSGGFRRALEIGVVDEVVDPRKSLGTIARAIAESGLPRRGVHGNTPL